MFLPLAPKSRRITPATRIGRCAATLSSASPFSATIRFVVHASEFVCAKPKPITTTPLARLLRLYTSTRYENDTRLAQQKTRRRHRHLRVAVFATVEILCACNAHKVRATVYTFTILLSSFFGAVRCLALHSSKHDKHLTNCWRLLLQPSRDYFVRSSANSEEGETDKYGRIIIVCGSCWEDVCFSSDSSTQDCGTIVV